MSLIKNVSWILLFAGVVVPPAAAADSIMLGGGFDLVPELYADETVKNTPVSVRITTRSVQQLFDGNRIVNSHEVTLYRDAQGRVRRELPGGMISIYDPVAGHRLLVDSAAQSVVKFSSASGAGRADRAVAVGGGAVFGIVAGDLPLPVDLNSVTPIDHAHLSRTTTAASTITMAVDQGLPIEHRPEVEPLGQKTLDGVRVEGTSYTTTYPAQTFGNEKPLTVRKESWYAPELRMMFRSEQTDPRFGTVSYATELLESGEPDAGLFVVPEGFSVIATDPASIALPLSPAQAEP